MKNDPSLQAEQASAKTSSMEWSVGPGRGGVEDGAFHPGQTTEPEAYLPFLEDDESPDTPAFNLDLRRFMIGVWQRRYIGMASVFMITTIMALLIGLSVDRQWQASTALIKRSHQDRLTLTERNPFKSQEYSLPTLLDTLKLPSSLEHVRQQAGLNVSLTTLAQAIDVSLGRDSKIINLRVTWSSPEKSSELANLVAETFVDRTRLLLGDDATSAYEYYTAQLEETRKNARFASADVLAFRQKYGISNLDAETKVLLEEMSRLESNLNSRIAEAGALKVASSRLIVALKDEPEQVITFTVYRSPLQTRLAEYEWELREAMSKYTELNPKVIKLNERIDSLKQMISSNNDEAIPENTYALNSKREDMELRLQLLTDDIKLREAQALALKQTMDTMKSKVAMLSDWEKDYLLLQSRLDGILSLEKELTRRVNETRLVIQRNDASFDIVEPAAIPTEAMPTGRKLMAIAALFFAVGSSFVLLLLLEWLDPMIRSKRDVTDIADSDCCAEIPEALTASSAVLDPSQPTGQLANLYRSLVNDIDVSVGKNSQPPIAIVSAGAGAGRSTVAANLARTRLTKGQKVLLVDADLRQQAGRRPHDLLSLATMQTGLYEHVLHGDTLMPLIEENGALQYIGASADKVTDDRGLVALGAKNLAKFLKPFQKGSYTIVDLPPVTDLEVTLEITAQLKNALIVVQSGVTRRNEFKKTMAQLKKRGINCIATVVLDVPAERLESAKLFALPTLGGPFRVWSKLSFA